MRKVLLFSIISGILGSIQAQTESILARPIDSEPSTIPRIELKSKGKYLSNDLWLVSDLLRETSGLYYDSHRKFRGIWTLNDGGNAPHLYRINLQNPAPSLDSKSNESITTKSIPYIKNVDWEAITGNGEYLFIGDFGNNRGTRKDLKIYRIASFYDEISPGIMSENIRLDSIEFDFPEQQDFEPRYLHNFDCEAMIAIKDTLYLFTKNWANRECDVYRLMNVSGKQHAQKVGHISTGYMVTDAAINGNDLFFVGYNFWGKQFISQLEVNTWKLRKTRKIKIKKGQIEGITILPFCQKILLSTEARGQEKARFFVLDKN